MTKSNDVEPATDEEREQWARGEAYVAVPGHAYRRYVQPLLARIDAEKARADAAVELAKTHELNHESCLSLLEASRGRIAELEEREALWRDYVEWLTQHARLPAEVTGDGSRGAELRRRLGL